MGLLSFVFLSIIVSRGLERFVLEDDKFIEEKWAISFSGAFTIFCSRFREWSPSRIFVRSMQRDHLSAKLMTRFIWSESSASETPSIHFTSFPLFLFLLLITLLISSGSCFEVSAVYLGFNIRKRIDAVMLVLDYRDALEYRLRVQSRLQIIEHSIQKYRLNIQANELCVCARQFIISMKFTKTSTCILSSLVN